MYDRNILIEQTDPELFAKPSRLKTPARNTTSS
jgi:hypothetical protein